MSGWIIVKREGQEIEVVHWGDLPERLPVKLREEHSHLWEEPTTLNAPGLDVTQKCSRCGKVRRL